MISMEHIIKLGKNKSLGVCHLETRSGFLCIPYALIFNQEAINSPSVNLKITLNRCKAIFLSIADTYVIFLIKKHIN